MSEAIKLVATRPIVSFAAHPWVEPEWMNRQQLLSRLGARGWPVAYSVGALDWWQRKSGRWGVSPWLSRIEDRDGVRDVIPGRLGVRWKRWPAFDRLAVARHARFIRSAVAKPSERIIALLFDPQFYPYIEHLQPCDVVFHAYDAYAAQAEWSDEKTALQTALLKQAALVTASSEGIARYLGDSRVKVLPNGADFDAFSGGRAQPEPDALRDIPHPRLGYVGAINRKVDLALVATLARDNPEWQWVLVGRIERKELLADSYSAGPLADCESLPNVHFLGQKDRREIPAYVGHMDVNTMCYRASGEGWWSAGSPLKLHEYLACGRPVISSPLEAVKPFSHVLAIVEGVKAWSEAIRLALLDDGPQKAEERAAVAARNSWDARVDLWEHWLHTDALDKSQFTRVRETR